MKFLLAVWLLILSGAAIAQNFRLQWTQDAHWTTNATLTVYFTTDLSQANWQRLKTVPASSGFLICDEQGFYKATVTDSGSESDFSNLATMSAAQLEIVK